MPRLTTLFDLQDRMSKKLRTITGDFKKLKSESDKPILIKATDRASKTIRSIDRSVHRLASRSYNVTVKSVDMASRSIGFIRNSLNSLPAWITIGVSVVGLEKLTRATIGAAAQMELAQVQVTSLFGENQKAAKAFFDFLNKSGAESMFSQQDFFGAGRAFVPLTKNLKELKYAVKLTERLAASDPIQGMEGASFAIREALSGDMVSLQERFELPRYMAKTIKEAPTLQDKLEALDKVLSKMGYNQRYLNKVNETGYVRWQKLIDSTKLKFTEFGKKGLEASKPLIDDLTKIVNSKSFDEFGKVLSDGIVWGVEKAHTAVKGLEKYLSDPKFQKLDFEGKVNFVLGDINKWWKDKAKPRLEEWWDNSGKPWAIKIGGDMGEVIFNGIVEGTKKGLQTVGGMWVDAFKNPSIGNFGGAAIGTIIAAGIGSMLLSPVLKTFPKIIKVLPKILKGGLPLMAAAGGAIAGGQLGGEWLALGGSLLSYYLAKKGTKKIGEKIKGKFSKEAKPKPIKTTMSYDDHVKQLMTQQNKSSKKLRFPKISKLGSGISKKVPFLGTALSIFDIFNAKGKSGKLKAVGSAGGSTLGGLLGSFLGPVGTLGGAALGGYLGGKAMGLFGGGGDSKSHVSASPPSPTMPNINMQDYLRKNIYQPLNQAITNSKKFGQAFANSFILGMNGIKISNWNITALYQPLNQAITNARLFGQAFAKTFMIGVNETPVSLSNWNITALYQPLNQAVLNSRLFGQAFAKTFVIGANESQASIHPWISQQIYIPLNQMVSNAQAFGIAFTSNFIIGLNSVKDTPFNWISDKIYKPILQAVGNALAFGQNFALNFKIGMTQAEFSIHSWISINLYQPIIQAIGNAKLFGISYARNIGIGVNGSPIDLHTWISSNLYQPILQAVGNAISFGSAFVGNFIYGMRSRKEDVSAEARALAKVVENAFRDEMGIHSPSKKMAKLGYWSAMGVIKGFNSVDIKKFIESQLGAFSFSGGKASGNVKKWITAALMITGTPMSWLGPLSTMAMKESGGNPRAINLWDSNAKRGTPSKGLMQTIDPTFNAYKLPGFNDIWNPIHNAIAAIRYIKARYGSVFNTPGIKNMSRGRGYKGYEKGGIINRQHLAIVGEKNKKEAIIPLEQHRNRALGLLSYAANKLGVQPQTLPTEAVQAASGASSARSSIRGMIGDIIIQITGDNHYSNDMDAERVGKIAFEFFKRKLEEEYFEGGAMAIYE